MTEIHTKMSFLGVVVLAVLVWVFETLVHLFLLTGDTFFDSLIFNISGHELYTRVSILVAFCMVYILWVKNKIIKEKETQINNIFNNVIPVCITNTNYEIVKANNAYWQIWGNKEGENIKCYEHRPGESCHTDSCPLTQINSGVKEFNCESKKDSGNEMQHFIITARPFYDSQLRVTGVIESFQDITAIKKLEREKEGLIGKLKESLANVKLLSGFIPICAGCKKIRDDKGYWNQIEAYLRDHSDAKFSHGLCPQCSEELYPAYHAQIQGKSDTDST